VSPDDLMLRYTEDVLKDKSACLNYDPDGTNPYPKATCISVNAAILVDSPLSGAFSALYRSTGRKVTISLQILAKTRFHLIYPK